MNLCYVFWCCACRKRPERSSRLTDIPPSLKRLYRKKVLLWLMALSPKASAAFGGILKQFCLILKENLMQILCSRKSVISVKKNAGSLKYNLTKRTEINNTSSQLYNCWHTDTQSILLATSSGRRAYDNRSGRAVYSPEFLGNTSHV